MQTGTLTTGAKLGPYEILSPLGAGGMGEVYLAKDTRLDRTVAVKVLPGHVSSSPDLKLRFEREARAISSLNHPNICSLYDVGSQGDIDYLVMEHLQGETLAARLERGPLPTEELLRIAVQIADALDKAHRQGLVHRDLKPLNIMLTKNGAKLLDFGLAKLQPTVVSGLSGVTHTSSPLTGEGAIVGTLQYMAPEQLEGKEADARSDIFSFGVVLYQMVTGSRPFHGGSQASLIASILKEEPRPITQFQPEAPPALERVIKQCLAKDPDERWQSARDLLHQLKWISEGGSLAGIPAPVAARRKHRLQIAWLAAAVLGVAAATLGVLYFSQSHPPVQTVKFSVLPGGIIRSMQWPRISPDGKLLAFLATDTTGKRAIWVRSLNNLDAYPLPGTENAGRPFWSPTSRYLAYVEAGRLKKIAATGGPAQLICEAPKAADGCWGSSDIILLDGSTGDPIWKVNANGGHLTEATAVDTTKRETGHAWPCFLPDGNHFIYLIDPDSVTTASGAAYTIVLASLDSDEQTKLFGTSARAWIDPQGYILYSEGKTLMARRFDMDALKVTGDPVPIAEIAMTSFRTDFDVSSNGVLVYRPAISGDRSELVWVDRSGREVDSIGGPHGYGDLSLSRDGNKVAYSRLDDTRQTSDIWVYDMKRRVASRVTYSEENDLAPLWSPNDTAMLYANFRNGVFTLMRKRTNSDGDGDVCLSLGSNTHAWPDDWSSDGSVVVMGRQVFGSQPDLGLWQPGTSRDPQWIASTPFAEVDGVLSPDGRFVAYTSNESGRVEVYVRQLDGPGDKWQISNEGGNSPLWSRDGKELYYYSRNTAINAVQVTIGTTLDVGATTQLFEAAINMTPPRSRRYEVSADRQRFLLNRTVTANRDGGIVAVLNWSAELPVQ